MNTDCPEDRPRCIFSNAGPATCEPLQDVAQPCSVNEDCLSNVCYLPMSSVTAGQPVCGECNWDNPCAAGERCFEMDVPHSYCAPKLGYNETCNVGEDCLSGNCHTRPQPWDHVTQTYVGESVMICADCGMSSECAEGEYCHWEYVDAIMPTYYDAPRCEPRREAGEQCPFMHPDSCISNYCWFPPPPLPDYSTMEPGYEPMYEPMYDPATIVCAECTPWQGTDSGCAPDQRCANDPDVAPYCAPKGEWGESCSMAEDCVSNLCVPITSDDPAYMYMSLMQCADWQGSYDCRDETRASYDSTRPRCVYDPSMSEPGLCDVVGVIGDVCTEPDDCVSSICEYKYGPMKSFCSECTVDSECAEGEACFLVPAGGNTCAPKAQNGATCEHDTDCASGFCAELFQGLHKKCVGCRRSDDCYDHPDGPVCIYNPHLPDPPVCGPLGGPGDYCNESWDCASNSCIYAPDSYDGTCA